jgi:hypothetical protein
MSSIKTSPIPFLRSKTPEQFRQAHGFSKRTWNRLKFDGGLPRLTWITSRKAIITAENEKEWLDARTDSAPAASPFPDADAVS